MTWVVINQMLQVESLTLEAYQVQKEVSSENDVVEEVEDWMEVS